MAGKATDWFVGSSCRIVGRIHAIATACAGSQDSSASSCLRSTRLRGQKRSTVPDRYSEAREQSRIPGPLSPVDTGQRRPPLSATNPPRRDLQWARFGPPQPVSLAPARTRDRLEEWAPQARHEIALRIFVAAGQSDDTVVELQNVFVRIIRKPCNRARSVRITGRGKTRPVIH